MADGWCPFNQYLLYSISWIESWYGYDILPYLILLNSYDTSLVFILPIYDTLPDRTWLTSILPPFISLSSSHRPHQQPNNPQSAIRNPQSLKSISSISSMISFQYQFIHHSIDIDIDIDININIISLYLYQLSFVSSYHLSIAPIKSYQTSLRHVLSSCGSKPPIINLLFCMLQSPDF